MNRVRLLLSYVMGFISAILITGLVLILLVKSMSDKNYILSVMKENNYYEQINDEIKEEMELALLSTGFTEEILENIYDKEEVVNDLNTFIDNLYKGKKTVLEKENIYQKIKENILDYTKKTNLEVTNQKDVEVFIKDLVGIYENEICHYNFLDSLSVILPKIIKMTNSTVLIISILLIINIVLVIIIKVWNFGASLMASGLMVLFIQIFIFEKIDADSLLIITEKFSLILQKILRNLQSNIYLIGFGLILVGIIVTVMETMCQHKKLK